MPLLLAAPQRMCSNSWGSELKRERCVYTLVGFYRIVPKKFW